MTLLRGFVTVIASSVCFGGVGTALGYLLGRVAPNYYRTVFRVGDDPEFNAVEVGVGLGLTQGLLAGLFVGTAVVLAVAWYRSQLLTSQGPPNA